jgi:hypothetical protein
MLRLLLCVQLVHDDCLYRARRRGSQNSQTLCIIRVGIEHERLFTAELEDIRRERDALCVAQALIQVNDNSHILPSFDDVHAFVILCFDAEMLDTPSKLRNWQKC